MISIIIEVLRTNHWCDYNVDYIRDTPIFGNYGNDTGNSLRKTGIFQVEVLTVGSNINRSSPQLKK